MCLLKAELSASPRAEMFKDRALSALLALVREVLAHCSAPRWSSVSVFRLTVIKLPMYDSFLSF